MFEDLVTKNILSLVPYPPGKPLEELERELGITGAIKLASNENPLGPSSKALAAMSAALPNLHRYPDGRGYYLKQALAEKHGLSMSEIVIGNGSNEIIELMARTFMQPGLKAVMSDPTFLVYSKVVQGSDGDTVRVPQKKLRHNLAGLAKAIDEHTRLIFLDNPNNPSGTLVPARELAAFIHDLPPRAIMVLDEAYVDFVRGADTLDPTEWIAGKQPIIFLRTFSKAYGLAGLRVGYGLAHRALIDYIDRVRQPFNVNSLAQIGALAALDDKAFYQKSVELVWSGLDWFAEQLELIGLTFYPTQANFFLIQVPKTADEVAQLMLHQGVIVRSMSSYGLPNVIRINVGLAEENERFLSALKRVLNI